MESLKQEQKRPLTIHCPYHLGNCTLDVNIRPGARNNVSWKTLSDIANAIPTTCAEGGGGGWGIFGIPPISMHVPVAPLLLRLHHYSSILFCLSSPSASHIMITRI